MDRNTRIKIVNMRKAVLFIKLWSIGSSIALGAIIAAAALYLQIIGAHQITFSFDIFHEHLTEAILFPATVILGIVFYLELLIKGKL